MEHEDESVSDEYFAVLSNHGSVSEIGDSDYGHIERDGEEEYINHSPSSDSHVQIRLRVIFMEEKGSDYCWESFLASLKLGVFFIIYNLYKIIKKLAKQLVTPHMEIQVQNCQLTHEPWSCIRQVLGKEQELHVEEKHHKMKTCHTLIQTGKKHCTIMSHM